MFYKCVVSGFKRNMSFWQQAWVAAQCILSIRLPQSTHVRYIRNGCIVSRRLTRLDMIFGIKDDAGADVFRALVAWRCPEVVVNLGLSRLHGSGDWIIQLTRDIITAAGWTIISEGEVELSCRRVVSMND